MAAPNGRREHVSRHGAGGPLCLWTKERMNDTHPIMHEGLPGMLQLLDEPAEKKALSTCLTSGRHWAVSGDICGHHDRGCSQHRADGKPQSRETEAACGTSQRPPPSSCPLRSPSWPAGSSYHCFCGGGSEKASLLDPMWGTGDQSLPEYIPPLSSWPRLSPGPLS